MDSPSDYLTPDELVAVEFETRRRGLDPGAVETHLRQAAESMRSILSDNEALRSEVAVVRAALERAESDRGASELSDAELIDRLGEDAAQVLADARAEAERLLAQADEDARRIRAEAESVFAERSVAADEEAERRRVAATEALAHDRAEAEAEAARLVDEAQIVRRRILEDLARRRSLARRQIEQLRVGRDRLISSHDTVRRVLDELSEELTLSMAEARAAAESAGHSVPETSIEELEAEIETARLSGLLDTGPVPVVTDDGGVESSEGAERRDEELPGQRDAESHDPVEVDSSVADLFARMRSTRDDQTEPDVSGATRADTHSRTKDSLRQR